MKLTTKQARKVNVYLTKNIDFLPTMIQVNGLRYLQYEIAEALQMGADALALQEPKKPRKEFYQDDVGYTCGNWIYCPKCGNLIGSDEHYDGTYCQYCGQKIDTESDN